MSTKTLLILTVGHTDVQLVLDNQRHKLDGNNCGALHDAIREREWSVADAPSDRSRDFIKTLPNGKLTLCTPKLDAILEHFRCTRGTLPTSALILETNRSGARDPRLAGPILERRLLDHEVSQVTRKPFLTDTQELEALEDPANELDAVVRRTVVAALSNAIAQEVESLNKGDRIFVATTGGLAAANEVINELVRLHAVGGPSVVSLEVPDGNRTQQDDRAVEEKFHPAAGYRARWHALSLIEKGNLVAAWGAVSHLENEPGQAWTQVVKWLYHFASSLPSPDCNLSVLNHRRMGVRAALRVELALRAGDIPRAVHSTAAFCEAALWDWLRQRNFPNSDGVASGDLDSGFTFRPGYEPTGDKKKRFLRDKNNGKWRIDDRNHKTDGFIAWLDILQKPKLHELWEAVNNVRVLRNDVAHNEPTLNLMAEARLRMRATKLWYGTDTNADTFLSQPLVQGVLTELGEPEPTKLLEALLAEVRRRLVKADA